MLEIEFNHTANDLINHAQERNPNNNSGPKIGGASWLVSIVMLGFHEKRTQRNSMPPSPDLAACMSFIWPFLVCILYNETAMVTKMFLVSSVSRSRKYLNGKGSEEPQIYD